MNEIKVENSLKQTTEIIFLRSSDNDVVQNEIFCSKTQVFPFYSNSFFLGNLGWCRHNFMGFSYKLKVKEAQKINDFFLSFFRDVKVL